jgi:hypothetical protein
MGIHVRFITSMPKSIEIGKLGPKKLQHATLGHCHLGQVHFVSIHISYRIVGARTIDEQDRVSVHGVGGRAVVAKAQMHRTRIKGHVDVIQGLQGILILKGLIKDGGPGDGTTGILGHGQFERVSIVRVLCKAGHSCGTKTRVDEKRTARPVALDLARAVSGGTAASSMVVSQGTFCENACTRVVDLHVCPEPETLEMRWANHFKGKFGLYWNPKLY